MMDKIDRIFYPSDLDQSKLKIAVTKYKNVAMVTKPKLKFKKIKILN
jgi:hypothetical protein